jgi:hypothetical protein
VIEQVRRLMLKSAQESASRESLGRRGSAIATEHQQQQQQQRSGADEHLQRDVWDLGGFR